MDAYGVGFHFAVSDQESRDGGMDFHLFCVGDLRFHVVGAGVTPATDLVGAEFGLDCARVFEQRRFITDGRRRTCSGPNGVGKLSA